MAPAAYDLGDYLSWPVTDALASQQTAWARIKIFPTLSNTWGSLYSTLNAGSNATKDFGSSGRMAQVCLRQHQHFAGEEIS